MRLTACLLLPQVSWIRQRQVNGVVKPALLTTGSFTYTSDQRFSAAFRSPPPQSPSPSLGVNGLASRDASASDWILQIKYVQLRDAGVYECQVSTEPRIAVEFHLTVVGKCSREMRNEIVSSQKDLFVFF